MVKAIACVVFAGLLLAQSDEVQKLGGYPPVSAPTLVYKVSPDYSGAGRKAKIEGTVVLYIEVTTEGKPRNIKVLRPLGYGLDEEAIKAVSNWRFKPGMREGIPVIVAATVEVNFRFIKAPNAPVGLTQPPPVVVSPRNPVAVPDFHVVWRDDGGAVKKLEHRMYVSGLKNSPRVVPIPMAGIIYWNRSIQRYEMSGAKSPIRFTPNSVPTFLVKLTSDANPVDWVRLLRLDVNKQMRHARTPQNAARPDKASVPLQLKPGDDGLLTIVTGPLPPGEYAFAIGRYDQTFCFGVDP